MGRTSSIRRKLQRGLRFGVAVVVFSSVGAYAANAQDVAEAARQEKARKAAAAAAAQEKSEKHVYSNDDLKRAKIITPEEQARIEARKKNSAAPGSAPNQTEPALDANNSKTDAAPAESLGEVARRFRREKAAREAEQALKTPPRSGFPLDLSQSALATPVPLRPPVVSVAPPAIRSARPSVVATPPGRRDPFSRSFRPQPAAPPTAHATIAPKAPVPAGASAARKRTPPTAPSTARLSSSSQPPVAAPVAPARTTVPAPIAPKATPPLAAVNPAASVVTIQPGDSLWKVARQHLGKGSRWPELVAANPGLTRPRRIQPGTSLRMPQPSATTATNSPLKISVVKGDSLWKLAQAHLGNGANWQCLAQANPQLQDANHIYPGQSLLVPAACASITQSAHTN